MRTAMVRNHLSLAIILGALILVSDGGALPRPAAQSSLRIVVIEGEDAVNIIQQKTAVAPVVEVRDRNDLPVAGVPVTFAITSQNAAFAGGLQQVTVVTNAAGRAVVAGVTPLTSGSVQIGVTATYQGQTAAITIAQTNVATAAQAANAAGASGGSGGGVSTGTVAGISGAAAGVAAAAATLAGGDDEPPRGPLTIAPSPEGAGIREVTVFTFIVRGGTISAPSYTWNFGDGATASGETATHLYNGEGTFQVTLRAVGSTGEETASATVIVGNLTGVWVAPIANGNHRLLLTQNGSSLTGRWLVEPGPGADYPFNDSALSGTVTTPRSVVISQDGDCERLLTGGVTQDLRVMGGTRIGRNPACTISSIAGTYQFTRQ